MSTDLAVIIGAIIGGAAAGVLGYFTHGRVERALRMILDRREQELEAARERERELVDQILTLRREGFTTDRAGTVIPAQDLEGEALARAEQVKRRRIEDNTFLQNAIAELKRKRPGLTDREALTEAKRLLEETRMEQPPG